MGFKTLADAVRIRNHVINVLEQASVVRDAEVRRSMLTFVVAGGGFSGTEVAAALNDCVRAALGDYRSLRAEELRVVLVHSGKQVLERELTPALARYATKTLGEQGIELVLGERLVAASPQSAVLGRRAEDLDAHADLDGALLAEPDRRADGVGDGERAGWSATGPRR